MHAVALARMAAVEACPAAGVPSAPGTSGGKGPRIEWIQCDPASMDRDDLCRTFGPKLQAGAKIWLVIRNTEPPTDCLVK